MVIREYHRRSVIRKLAFGLELHLQKVPVLLADDLADESRQSLQGPIKRLADKCLTSREKTETHVSARRLITNTRVNRTAKVQAAMIHSEMVKTSSTVPGQMVMRVFITKRVLKLILLSAPMLRDEASVKSLLCSSMTRAMRYSRRNMGMDRMMSTSASVLDGT
ncbi:hypothetical protein EYF80_018408 [Liparis tanakae]|uniref:Uncharacterized protein n=1 Tax=Liparis tanakae TaxID=230148 RepID=A0A4Z2I0L2_9TELE|nr:hypothetical protein EYF80_018408 [Liparis tanakae]